MQEKPFQGINGSGKHNNWSFSTVEGAQLLNPAQFYAKTGNAEVFPVVMAALVSAIDKHGDLLRMSIASPGNDFRLGAMEVRRSGARSGQALLHARTPCRSGPNSSCPARCAPRCVRALTHMHLLCHTGAARRHQHVPGR